MPLIIGENKAQKLYLGEIECKKAYLGHELVFGDAKTSSLPEGYTEVAYIHLSGSCGFKTKYKTTTPSKTRILMDVEFDERTASASEYLFGVIGAPSGSSSSRIFFVIYRNSTTSLKASFGVGSLKTLYVGDISGVRTKIDVDGPGGTVSVGNFNSSIEFSTQTITSDYLYIGKYAATSSIVSFPGKLYSTKIYINGVLESDFVPCTNAFGVAGLFDLVRNEFISDRYDGNVIAGPPV